MFEFFLCLRFRFSRNRFSWRKQNTLQFLCLITVFIWEQAWTHTLSLPEQQKTTPDIIEKAEAGVEQIVGVTFEHSKILEKERKKKKEKGLELADQSILEETSAEFEAIRNEVFPKNKVDDDMVLEHSYKHIPSGVVRIRNINGLEKLLRHPNVEKVHRIETYRPLTIQSLPLINQPYAVTVGPQGAGTVVAVLDTGGAFRHEIFSTSRKYPACKLPWEDLAEGDYIGTGKCRVLHAVSSSNEDFSYADISASHGENVAGIAASVAPLTKIAAIDVFFTSSDNSALTNDLIVAKAIDWIIDHLGSHSSGNRIVAANMSFGDGTAHSKECSGSMLSPYFARLIENAVVPVVATGNDKSITGVSSPACVPGAVRVGAVYDANLGPISYEKTGCTDSSTKADMIPCFSNGNSLVTILAPGARIAAAGATASGTSQAAPHVSGAVAFLRGSGAFPGDNVSATRNRIVNNGVPIKDPRNGITRPRLDLYRAYIGATPPLNSPSSTSSLLTSLLNFLILD